MIQPDIWGPHGWKFMHYISLGYPMNPSENDKLNYKNFYYSLQYVLPCEKCQINYRRNILENPIDKFLKDRKSLTKWVIDIHNKVNQETNKPIYDYEEAILLYKNQKNTNEYLLKIILFIIFIIILYLFFKDKSFV